MSPFEPREIGLTYDATIDELMSNFRSALVALSPIADAASMRWQDPHPHDDWDKLAEAAFDAFVASPIRTDASSPPDLLPLARYDFAYDSYQDRSWLRCEAQPHNVLAFVGFETLAEAFDHVSVVHLDPTSLRRMFRSPSTVAWTDCRWFFRRATASGARDEVASISAIE